MDKIIKILIELDILELWIIEYHRQNLHRISRISSIKEDLMTCINTDSFLSYTLSWESTLKGPSFWVDKHVSFQKMLIKHEGNRR